MVDSRIMSDIMEVPLPRACSKRLMSFFTFHISMFFSASLAWGALIVSESGEYGRSDGRYCQAKVRYPEFPESLEGIPYCWWCIQMSKWGFL